MNAESYFESEPWINVVEVVRKGNLGRIAAFAIQASCSPGEVNTLVQQWRERIDGLFGPPEESDTVAGEQAASLLLRYHSSMIGRIFIDESPGEPFCNIEIVGADALLVWKPDVQPLSTLRSTGKQQVTYQHPCATSLTGEALS